MSYAPDIYEPSAAEVVLLAEERIAKLPPAQRRFNREYTKARDDLRERTRAALFFLTSNNL